ncbi:trypsin-like serine protease [uncultured Tateyamaria sp.]|uniref:trypsin-like serine peptidase n=2 Tax=uncultured Tateyamaria sp. TaxID=455651 RepID=UPI00261C52D6|nr:trypsin-like serine protease [uncultured Tateyamaria sp.]
MRRWMALSFAALVLASTALAQDAQLRRLESGADAAGWEAVGRLNIGGTGFCTGALIAPNLVLTAGHCLFDKTTGERIDHTRVEFLAGWRNGRASAYRNVRRAVVHPDYTYAGHVSSKGVRNDLALLELDHPIRDGKIIPFETAAQPRRGAEVGVVSYGTGRSEAPSLQELCRVLAQQDGLLVTSCSVEFGSSGAPIFVIDEGRAQIVSVVSAKAEVDGEAVSLGTSLGTPLARLQAELVAQRDDISPRILGGMRRETGAKFVKP